MKNVTLAGIVLTMLGVLGMGIARLDVGNVTSLGLISVAVFIVGIVLALKYL